MSEQKRGRRRPTSTRSCRSRSGPRTCVATKEARPQPYEKGEHDRETEFMLRTTGLFI